MIQAFTPMNHTGETLTAGASSVTTTGAAETGTMVARICATDNPIRYRVSHSGAAAGATSAYLPAGIVEYVLVSPGARISAIRAGSTDASVSVIFGSR